MLENLLNNKKVFIFDLDGTLIDSVGIWNKVDQKLISDLANILVDEFEININRDHILGASRSSNPYLDYIIYLKNTYKIEKSVDEIYAYRRSIMNEFLINDVKKMPFAKELIAILKENNFTLALATTTTRKNLETYAYQNEDTKDLDLLNNFTVILTMEDVDFFKPNPEIFLKVMAQLKAKKEEIIVIEDSIVGIRGAKNAGLDAIAVKEVHSHETTEELKNTADIYIDSLEEIYEYYRKKVPKMAKIS